VTPVLPAAARDGNRRVVVARARGSRSAASFIDLTFVVEPRRIQFFADFLEREDRADQRHVTEARDLAASVATSWAHGYAAALDALSVLGLAASLDGCLVSVLPPSFMLGASRTDAGLILYGQPERGPVFAAALLAHELAHIGLARAGAASRLDPAVVEGLCFLVEGHVHRHCGGAGLRDIWITTELDQFHRRALDAAVAAGGGLDAAPVGGRGRGGVDAWASRLRSNVDAEARTTRPLGLLAVLREEAASRRGRRALSSP